LPDSPKPPAHGRAGRNLPAAIAVGLLLGAMVTVPLFTVRWVFALVVVAAVVLGTWEMVRSLAVGGVRAPYPPLAVGGAAMIGLAWWHGPAGLVLGLLLTAVAVALWRLAFGAAGYLRDVSAAVLVATYVGFLAGYCLLLAVPADGAVRVTIFVATVVCSDVGGYAAGVFFGRHPMAPTVSPKKSWEGAGGSALACGVGGILFLTFVFGGAWWQGLVYGLSVMVAATLGDLGESAIKRDLGVKDMGTLLPGHGGIMDRLDSLLVAAPVAYLLLSAFIPPH
jgi:phosphatidate cytidylyltransferase